jgi:flagellar hook-associated protein 2
MGTISSSVGLISGMDIQQLVTQLMAIEARPLNLLKQRIQTTVQQQTAFTELSARLTAAKSAVQRLALASSYSVTRTTSSQPEVLTATASAGAALDSYTFQVRSLVTTHQLVSGGFADRDRTPVGGGTLTFEMGQGRIDSATALSTLNGFQGVRRGTIRITDRSGASADVDLRAAVTVNDVLEAINSQTGVSVQAKVSGDRIVLVDQSGGSTASLRVQDIGGGFAATDLGIAGTAAVGATQMVGSDLVSLSDAARLSLLNDGRGVRTQSGGVGDDLRFTLRDGREITVSLSGNVSFQTRLASLNDGRGVQQPGTIRITNRAGASQDITIDGASTLQDVANAIGNAGLSVSVSLSGSRMVLTDSSGGTSSNFKIEDVSGTAAADLGIVADSAVNSISGASIYRVNTLGGVFRAIQYAAGNDGALSAAVDGNGITLTDHTVGAFESSVEAVAGSQALQDLGLSAGFDAGGSLRSRDLVAGLNTVLLASLNGGRGVTAGDVQFTRRDGSNVVVSLAGAQSLGDIIERINSAEVSPGVSAGLSARLDAGGTGIVITDSTAGAGTLAVSDLSGTAAADLRLTSSAPDTVGSGDLQRQYISENTLLSALNGGRGISYSRLQITTSDGRTANLSLSAGAHQTIGQVIRAINDLELDVEARVNSNGDGIELVDNAGGAGRLKVTEQGSGTMAADLGILGEAAEGETLLTGSFARSVTIGAGDTLDQVASKINAAKAGVTARIVNDGTVGAPYRLVLTSSTSGLRGELAYSTGSTGLSLRTLTQARDAVLVVGGGDSADPIVVTSSSNTITDVVEGVTLNLLGTSNSPVTVQVDRDIESVVTDIGTFVKTFNDAMDRIAELTKFIPETETKGILLGDSTVQRIQSRLYAQVNRALGGDAALQRLSQIGVTLDKARLKFDSQKFRDTFADNEDAVKELFTLVTQDSEGKPVKQGIAARLSDELDNIVNASTGLIGRKNETLQDRVDLYNRRATDMQELLDLKEARLYAKFQAMETALARLQAQQASLGALSSAVTTAASGLSFA